MRQVRIIFVEEIQGDYDILATIARDITDWEEVSDEEFDFLMKNLRLMAAEVTGSNHLKPQLIVKDEVAVRERITGLQQIVARMKAKQAERARRAAEAADARAKKRAEKQLAAKRKQFEALAEELGIK